MEGMIGEIRTWANAFAPRGWMYCEGQELPISRYSAMFSVLGIAFGGNGTTTFRLPDLRGKAAIGAGTGPGLTPRTLGQTVGAQTATLTESQLPPHRHLLSGSSQPASSPSPAGAYPATSEDLKPYAASANGAMATATISPAGQGQPHDNLQPYTAVRYIICVDGYFPVRS